MAKKLTTDNLPHIFGAVKDYVEGRIGEAGPGSPDTAEEATEQDVLDVAGSVFGTSGNN